MPNKKGNFIFLLVGIVTMLFASAIAQQLAGTFAQVVFKIFTIVALAISVLSIIDKRGLFQIAIAIIGIEIVISIIDEFMATPILRILDLFFIGLFFYGMTVVAFKRVLFSGPIDNNRIVGAICIYLLLGLIWAVLYAFLLELGMGDFNNLGDFGRVGRFSELIYFSFVTLSTLGYGDISPITPIARFFVYMEALTGQFYLAILVASLIGARFSQSSHDTSK